MRNLDFSSWNGLLTTLFGLVMVSLVAVGIRLVFMQAIQRRQQRENRQINERLKTLIAAYKTLGGSFTGELSVDPLHLGEMRRRAAEAGVAHADDEAAERRRRIRDAVEAALSDVILLGTEAQVRLAAQAANEMVAGRPVQVKALVVSLRDFIREALDLEPMPKDVAVPEQGPLRIAASGGKGGGGGNKDGGGQGGKGGAGGGMGGMGAGGMGMGLGMGLGHGAAAGDDSA